MEWMKEVPEEIGAEIHFGAGSRGWLTRLPCVRRAVWDRPNSGVRCVYAWRECKGFANYAVSCDIFKFCKLVSWGYCFTNESPFSTSKYFCPHSDQKILKTRKRDGQESELPLSYIKKKKKKSLSTLTHLSLVFSSEKLHHSFLRDSPVCCWMSVTSGW